MTVYQERKDDLERYEFMMGLERGRLAVTLDCITDALVLVATWCLLPERAPAWKAGDGHSADNEEPDGRKGVDHQRD